MRGARRNVTGRLEPGRARCQKAAMSKPTRELTAGQRAYEAKRAAKAGVSLDRWLADKARAQEEAARAERKAAEAARPVARKPGLLARLIDRAHKPL